MNAVYIEVIRTSGRIDDRGRDRRAGVIEWPQRLLGNAGRDYAREDDPYNNNRISRHIHKESDRAGIRLILCISQVVRI